MGPAVVSLSVERSAGFLFLPADQIHSTECNREWQIHGQGRFDDKTEWAEAPIDANCDPLEHMCLA